MNHTLLQEIVTYEVYLFSVLSLFIAFGRMDMVIKFAKTGLFLCFGSAELWAILLPKQVLALWRRFSAGAPAAEKYGL